MEKEKKYFKTKAGTDLPILDIKGKNYLQVAQRIVWFREEHPDWGIETTPLLCELNRTIFHASVKDPSGRIIGTGHKTEDQKGFPDHYEKAETGAIGRALGFIGYGTQFAPELDEGNRLLDSPIEKKTVYPNPVIHRPDSPLTAGSNQSGPTCSVCNTLMRRSEKKGSWYCPNFDDKKIEHDRPIKFDKWNPHSEKPPLDEDPPAWVTEPDVP